MSGRVRILIGITLAAVTARLFSMTLLTPLNWDEVEFFRATDWVRQGLVPFRDFWEHHTPLQWFVFAPFTALTKSPGAAAIIWMRWVQVPLWVVLVTSLSSAETINDAGGYVIVPREFDPSAYVVIFSGGLIGRAV